MDKPELKGLCMRCRDENKKPTMQVMNSESIVVTENNNRYSAKGTCENCKGNMFKFLSKDDAAKYQG